jgi:hypothetical protein
MQTCRKGGAFAHSKDRSAGATTRLVINVRRSQSMAPDLSRDDAHSPRGASHRTLSASPGPHCARAHDHAIRDLRPSTQALPSRQNPIPSLLEGAHAPAQHTEPFGRRRSRHPPNPSPWSRRSRRRCPRRGHSRQARHASVRSMKTTYRGATRTSSRFHLARDAIVFYVCCDVCVVTQY